MTTLDQTPITRTTLRAEGFTCPSCVSKIERQVGRLDGVEAVRVHFASQRIEIDHDPAKVDDAALVAAVARAGYTATPAAY